MSALLSSGFCRSRLAVRMLIHLGTRRQSWVYNSSRKCSESGQFWLLLFHPHSSRYASNTIHNKIRRSGVVDLPVDSKVLLATKIKVVTKYQTADLICSSSHAFKMWPMDSHTLTRLTEASTCSTCDMRKNSARQTSAVRVLGSVRYFLISCVSERDCIAFYDLFWT